MNETEQLRKQRERLAAIKAKEQQKPVVYIDDDGCEVTVTTQGYAFYNVADWW